MRRQGGRRRGSTTAAGRSVAGQAKQAGGRDFLDMRHSDVGRGGTGYTGDHEVGRIAAGAERAIVYI